MKAFSVSVAILLLPFLSCTIADPAVVALICDPSNPCPEGRQCTDGQCSDPSIPDASVNDLVVTPDLVETPGCRASNGTRLGIGQWLCPGSFGGTSPKASMLCAPGFAICVTLDSNALAICNATPGFFASTFIGSRRDPAPAGTGQCDQKEAKPVVYGCGSSGYSASTTCSGLTRVIDCATSVVWICGATIDSTTSPSPTSGVLCCR